MMRLCTTTFALGALLVIGCSSDDGEEPNLGEDQQASIVTGQKVGWAFYNSGLLDNYNSSGGCVSATHGGTGLYTVQFCGIGWTSAPSAGGNVQVTAVGASNERCNVASWTSNWLGTLSIDVRCRKGNGNLSDSGFVVEYVKSQGGQSQSALGAYVWMDQPAGGTLSTQYMWGDSITVTRLAQGRYDLNFATQNMNAGNVEVTAYGTGTQHCKVESWGSFKATVRCYTETGALSDTQFTLRYTLGTLTPDCGSPGIFGPGIFDTIVPGGTDTGGSGGYVLWNGSIPSANNYSILEGIVTGTICTTGCGITSTPVTITYISTGKYLVKYPDIIAAHTQLDWQLPIVTGYGADAKYCKFLDYWKTTSTGTEATVNCWTGTGGALTDANFSTILYSRGGVGC